MNDIYSPENIARSRMRAAALRAMVADGRLDARDGWLTTADEVDAAADERETVARQLAAQQKPVYDLDNPMLVDPADETQQECCQ